MQSLKLGAQILLSGLSILCFASLKWNKQKAITITNASLSFYFVKNNIWPTCVHSPPV
jgi:hypothetical protein